MDTLTDENAGSLVLAAVEGSSARFHVTGSWTIRHASNLEKTFGEVSGTGFKVYDFCLEQTSMLDTSGAWILFRIIGELEKKGAKVSFSHVSDDHEILLSAIREASDKIHNFSKEPEIHAGFLKRMTKSLHDGLLDTFRLISLLGALVAAFGRRLINPSNFRLASLVTHMMRTGLTAVPIIVLMSFVIGAIIAQQAAYQLSFYGAEPMAVDMVAVLVTRDMGVLLTAIMISGRSGSAYTAEIGSMKMREEIDALKVIGLDPVDVLLFPRIAALILVLPILTVISDYASLLGAQLALWLYIDMSWEIFLNRTRDAVPLAYFMMGIIKAPFMALIIGLIAMSEGLKVKGSSESLSKHTTTSVVKSIFLVIVIDGIFAVISASLGY